MMTQAAPRQTILVIEDQPTIADVIVRALRFTDRFEIEVAHDGISGWEMFLHVQPGCGIVDLKLPGMDGCTLMERVRATPAIAHTPLIMVTALPSEADQAKGYRAGADAFVVKPFRVEVLLATVETVMSLSPEIREARRHQRSGG
jgi:DNA-binding response OmpR family regulator